MLRLFYGRKSSLLSINNINFNSNCKILHKNIKQVSFLSTNRTSINDINKDNGNINISKRQLFRNIKPETKTVDFLDKLHLGYCSKRKYRVAIAKKFGPKTITSSNNSERNGREITSPFSKKKNRSNAPMELDEQPKNIDQVIIPHSPADRVKRIFRPFPFNRVGEVLGISKSHHEMKPFISNSGYITPEVAIVGRSNVGKSTLINSLLGFDGSYIQKSSMSDKPGETRNLHFYKLGSIKSNGFEKIINENENENKIVQNNTPGLLLVDMPGYGFSFMSEKDSHECKNMMSDYLLNRGSSLKRVLLLLDARHGLKIGDIEFFKGLLINQHPTDEKVENKKKDKLKIKWHLQIVLTKCDLMERMELARRMQQIRESIDDLLPGNLSTNLQVMALSSIENRGIMELQKELTGLVPPPKSVPIKNLEEKNIIEIKKELTIKERNKLFSIKAKEKNKILCSNNDDELKGKPEFNNKLSLIKTKSSNINKSTRLNRKQSRELRKKNVDDNNNIENNNKFEETNDTFKTPNRKERRRENRKNAPVLPNRQTRRKLAAEEREMEGSKIRSYYDDIELKKPKKGSDSWKNSKIRGDKSRGGAKSDNIIRNIMC
jgi:GTP-binding protein EngB required for normal cell division